MTSVRGYRLVKRKWLKTAFDGEGARLYGGRWNSKGKACVYLASTESLAMLEVMVHLEDNQLLKEYALLEVTFPEELLMQLPEDVLPADWRAEPAPPPLLRSVTTGSRDSRAWRWRSRVSSHPGRGTTSSILIIPTSRHWSMVPKKSCLPRTSACSGGAQT